MKFENSGLENMKADLRRLTETMNHYSLICEATWDYERVTFDRKFELKDGIYYLRVQGYAIEGDVGANKAVIQLMSPLLGKHYYPHGIEYGEGENFPKSLVSKCEEILANLKQELDQIGA